MQQKLHVNCLDNLYQQLVIKIIIIQQKTRSLGVCMINS